jgi:hypothetical protein
MDDHEKQKYYTRYQTVELNGSFHKKVHTFFTTFCFIPLPHSCSLTIT